MVAGMVLDQNGNPVPTVERLQRRFGIGSVCIVAGRAMISAETLAEVELREWQYILGVRQPLYGSASQTRVPRSHRKLLSGLKKVFQRRSRMPERQGKSPHTHTR